MINILLTDDHAVLRHGLRLILQEDPKLNVIGEASSGTEAVTMALSLSPDVVVMDVELPDISGIEATRRIRAARPETRILMLTVSDRNDDLLAAIKAGAKGYMLKNMEGQEVMNAIHRVDAGDVVLPPHLAARLMEELAEPQKKQEELTHREVDVLRHIALGLGNKEIGTALNISENTVKTHVRHILAKLNLRSRAEAAAYAVKSGLTPRD